MHAISPADKDQRKTGRALLTWIVAIGVIVLAVATPMFSVFSSADANPAARPLGPETKAVVEVGLTDRATAEAIIADTANTASVTDVFAELHVDTAVELEGNLFREATIGGLGESSLVGRRVTEGRLPELADEIVVTRDSPWEIGQQVGLATHDYGVVPVTVVGRTTNDDHVDVFAHPAMVGVWFERDLSGLLYVAGEPEASELVEELGFFRHSAALPIERITTAADYNAGQPSPIPLEAQWFNILLIVLAVVATSSAVGRLLLLARWWWVLAGTAVAGLVGGVIGAGALLPGAAAAGALGALIVGVARLDHQRRLDRRVEDRPGQPTNADLAQVSVGLAIVSVSLVLLGSYAVTASRALQWGAAATMAGVLIPLIIRMIGGARASYFGARMRSVTAVFVLALAVTVSGGGIFSWLEQDRQPDVVQARSLFTPVPAELAEFADTLPGVSEVSVPRAADVVGPLGTVEQVYLVGEPGSETLTLAPDSRLRSELVSATVTELTTASGAITATVAYGEGSFSTLDPQLLPEGAGLPGDMMLLKAEDPAATTQDLAASSTEVAVAGPENTRQSPTNVLWRAIMGAWLMALGVGLVWWSGTAWAPERRNRYFEAPTEPPAGEAETWRPPTDQTPDPTGHFLPPQAAPGGSNTASLLPRAHQDQKP